MTDEGAASRSLAAVGDVTSLRHVIVSAHSDVAVYTSVARSRISAHKTRSLIVMLFRG